MRLALLLAWLLMGAVDGDWWSDTDPAETGDVSKMDGTDETPPPPKP